MTYYKAFDKDLKCIGFQFEVGETYRIEGKLKMCENGFHCCSNILNCLDFYPSNSRFCEVTVGLNMLNDKVKTVTDEITIGRELIGWIIAIINWS